jgi:hypothetical protein
MHYLNALSQLKLMSETDQSWILKCYHKGELKRNLAEQQL